MKKKVLEFLIGQVPIIGFMLFMAGGVMFVIGHNHNIASFVASGAISGITGFLLFVYGNMLLDDYEAQQQ